MTISVKDLHLKRPASAKDKPGLFDSLDEKSLQMLLGNASMIDVPAGKLLVQQGDTPKYLYYIVQGRLKTFRTDAEGGEATIRMLNPGETCMDAVIFMGGPSPINVQAVEAAHILAVPETFVRGFVLQNPQFSTNLLRIVTWHYKNAMQQLDGIITKSPVQRLGYYLLKLHLEQGNHKLDIKLPFKKSLIANHLGMTPETFSRALKELKTYGVDIHQEQISLRDAYALCHFCDSDMAFLCTSEDKMRCDVCQFRHLAISAEGK